MQRLRPLDETECYLRCYGWRGSEEFVRVLGRDEPPPVVARTVTAERIRDALEAMLDARAEIDAREPEAA